MNADEIKKGLEKPKSNVEFFTLLPFIFDKKFDGYLQEIFDDCLTYAHSIYSHTKFPEKKVGVIKKWDAKTVENLFYPIVSKDELRQPLTCIKIEENWIIGTDAHILCKTGNYTNIQPDTYRLNKIVKHPTTENLIGNLHPNWPLNIKFPNYEQVLPSIKDAVEVKEIKIVEFYNFLFHYLKHKIYLHSGNAFCKIGLYSKIDIHLDAKHIIRIFEFMLKIGDKSAKVFLYGADKAIRIISDNTDALIMPLLYQIKDITLDCTKFLI